MYFFPEFSVNRTVFEYDLIFPSSIVNRVFILNLSLASFPPFVKLRMVECKDCSVQVLGGKTAPSLYTLYWNRSS